MVITAVIDRIEEGNVILLSDEMGVEIAIPAETMPDKYQEGERILLTIDGR